MGTGEADRTDGVGVEAATLRDGDSEGLTLGEADNVNTVVTLGESDSLRDGKALGDTLELGEGDALALGGRVTRLATRAKRWDQSPDQARVWAPLRRCLVARRGARSAPARTFKLMVVSLTEMVISMVASLLPQGCIETGYERLASGMATVAVPAMRALLWSEINALTVWRCKLRGSRPGPAL